MDPESNPVKVNGTKMMGFCMSRCLGSTAAPNGVGNGHGFAEMLQLPHMKNLGSDLSMVGKIRNEDDTNPAKLFNHHCRRPPINIKLSPRNIYTVLKYTSDLVTSVSM